MSSLLSPLLESPIVAEAARKNGVHVGQCYCKGMVFSQDTKPESRKPHGKRGFFLRGEMGMLLRDYNRVQRHGGPLAEQSMSPQLHDLRFVILTFRIESFDSESQY